MVTRARDGDQRAWDAPVPYPQISARLGIPVGSIGPTRSRCLDKLRRHPDIAALIADAGDAGAAARGRCSRRGHEAGA